MEKDELLIDGVVLIVLSDEFEIEDVATSNEKDEYEMAIVTDCDIQEFKESQTMYWIYDDVNMSMFLKFGMEPTKSFIV